MRTVVSLEDQAEIVGMLAKGTSAEMVASRRRCSVALVRAVQAEHGPGLGALAESHARLLSDLGAPPHVVQEATGVDEPEPPPPPPVVKKRTVEQLLKAARSSPLKRVQARAARVDLLLGEIAAAIDEQAEARARKLEEEIRKLEEEIQAREAGLEELRSEVLTLRRTLVAQ